MCGNQWLQEKIMGFEEIRQRVLENRSVIRGYGVRRIGFFGSYVRGQETSGSDVDLLVDFDPDKLSFDSYMDLTFFLEDLLGISVDLLTFEQISPHIMPYIQKEIQYESL
jgi:predicted nucleotidyltransferase